MFNVRTWVSDGVWLNDPKPMHEIEKDFYLFDDPKNEEKLRKLMNVSNVEESPNVFTGFVEVTYNEKEILGQVMFSLINHVWAMYEDLLSQMHEKGVATVYHPEGDIVAINLFTDQKDPSKLILEVFPDSNEERQVFFVPKRGFLKAIYNGLVTFNQIMACYCENEEVKSNYEENVEFWTNHPLY